jgi:Leucine-rich repeat (LRR) protein
LTKVDGLATLAESLTELNISDTGIREFQWLSKFVKLESLYAHRVGLNDTSLLEGMIYLRWLGLGGNGISDLSGLKNTSKLEEVDLSCNKLSDVSVLSRSVAVLRVVHLESNALSDLTPLSEAMNLEEVYVDENGLQNLRFLKGHENLRILSASKNQIDSLYGLSLGAKLRYMNLADNKLRSVGAGELVFGKDEYVVLDLGGNELIGLSLPTECTYKMLNLLGNSRLSLTELGSAQGWDLYFEFSEDVTVEQLKALDFNNLYIVGCPLDRRVELEEGLVNENLITAEEAQAEIEKTKSAL